VTTPTAARMLDEELMDEIRKDLPEDIETMFISSVTGYNITELKDVLWKKLNS
jgi:GTPase